MVPLVASEREEMSINEVITNGDLILYKKKVIK